ncbi:MAG: hypothetical protein WC071_11885 [Victivallaceae bacterium]
MPMTTKAKIAKANAAVRQIINQNRMGWALRVTRLSFMVSDAETDRGPWRHISPARIASTIHATRTTGTSPNRINEDIPLLSRVSIIQLPTAASKA